MGTGPKKSANGAAKKSADAPERKSANKSAERFEPGEIYIHHQT
jgi:hypothetical protein